MLQYFVVLFERQNWAKHTHQINMGVWFDDPDIEINDNAKMVRCVTHNVQPWSPSWPVITYKCITRSWNSFNNSSPSFDEDFSYKVVRIFFDQLYGVKTNLVSLDDALELVFCNHECQIDQRSDFETRLYDEFIPDLSVFFSIFSR